MELQPEELDVADVLRGVHAVLKPLVEKKGQTLDLVVEPGVATVIHDPSRFRQVIYNLLSNANKFTPDGGALRTLVRMDERGWLVVAVSDQEHPAPVHAAWHPIRLEAGPWLVEGDLPTLPGFDPGRALTRPTGTCSGYDT